MILDEKKLIDSVNQLCESEKYDDAEILVQDYAKQNPNNIDMLLRAAYFEYDTIHYDEQGQLYLEQVLNLDPNNLDALILLSSLSIEVVKEDLFEKLCNVKTRDPEYASMIEYCKSFHYNIIRNDALYKESLKKSIKLYPYYVNNYTRLCYFYEDKGDILKAKDLLTTAISNVKYIYPENDKIDYMDYKEYINELVKGIHLPLNIYEYYKQRLKELEIKAKLL